MATGQAQGHKDKSMADSLVQRLEQIKRYSMLNGYWIRETDLSEVCRAWQADQGKVEDENLAVLKAIVMAWDVDGVDAWRDALANARRICGFKLASPTGREE